MELELFASHCHPFQASLTIFLCLGCIHMHVQACIYAKGVFVGTAWVVMEF